jgi:hypothetical protein
MTLCQTQPIIESSTDLGFCCWNVGYKGFKEQLEAAGLSIFRNSWSNIHNFSKQKAASWRFIDESKVNLRAPSFLKQQLPDEVAVWSCILRAFLLQAMHPSSGCNCLPLCFVY